MLCTVTGSRSIVINQTSTIEKLEQGQRKRNAGMKVTSLNMESVIR